MSISGSYGFQYCNLIITSLCLVIYFPEMYEKIKIVYLTSINIPCSKKVPLNRLEIESHNLKMGGILEVK